MRTARLRIGLAGLLVLTAGSAVAQQTYWFTAETGDWSEWENWFPPGPPQRYDTAIILSGNTCFCADPLYSYRALSVEVQGGATLIIRGAQLGLGEVDQLVTVSTVDGTLRFEGTDPILMVDANPSGRLELHGSGTISASLGDACQPGTIAWPYL